MQSDAAWPYSAARTRMVHGVPVHGVQVDEHTRCAHYHQDIDVIAIKHFCCGEYYPCHLCHQQVANHQAVPWPAANYDQPAVLCGMCGVQLSVSQYLLATSCPACQAQFNPGCKLHSELYFAPADQPTQGTTS